MIFHGVTIGFIGKNIAASHVPKKNCARQGGLLPAAIPNGILNNSPFLSSNFFSKK
jgi:hypothetical protein